jgi:hypothetical protein
MDLELAMAAVRRLLVTGSNTSQNFSGSGFRCNPASILKCRRSRVVDEDLVDNDHVGSRPDLLK